MNFDSEQALSPYFYLRDPQSGSYFQNDLFQGNSVAHDHPEELFKAHSEREKPAATTPAQQENRAESVPEAEITQPSRKNKTKNSRKANLIQKNDFEQKLSKPLGPAYYHKIMSQRRNKHMDSSRKQNEEFRLRDTKNLVKNIFRQFQGWAQKHTPRSEEIQSLLKQLLSENRGKYNNNLVVKLSQQDKLRRTFIAFSEEEAQQIIGQSSINDKHSHLQALRNYRQICLEKESSFNNFENKKSNSSSPQLRELSGEARQLQ